MQQILSEAIMGGVIASLTLGMLCSVLRVRTKLSPHKMTIVVACGVIALF